jgi:hypothetical protein
MCSPIEPEEEKETTKQQQSLLQHRRTSTPPAIFSNQFEKEYLQHKEMEKLFQLPFQQSTNNSICFSYNDDSNDNKSLQTKIQKRRKLQQTPMYFYFNFNIFLNRQQQKHYYRSPYLLTQIGGDEGGSTSGRGTMPPGGYYGSSPASDSSPVFFL